MGRLADWPPAPGTKVEEGRMVRVVCFADDWLDACWQQIPSRDVSDFVVAAVSENPWTRTRLKKRKIINRQMVCTASEHYIQLELQ